MKRTLTLLVALCICVEIPFTVCAGEPFAAVKAIVGRLAGGYNGAAVEGRDSKKANAAMRQFVFAQDGSIVPGAGRVEAVNGKIKITASDASGASFALGQYLRHVAKTHISWCGNRESGKYPLPTRKITYTPAVPVRFAYNYTTLSYTMAFWSEKEWREEIDRLALSGYNVALVLQGLQEAWRVTLESVKRADDSRVYSDEQIMRFVSDEAAQAWWHMGNLEGLGGPLGGEKGDYFSKNAYAKFITRCKTDAKLGEYIYAEMMKLGIQPSIQSFVGLVPDCSNPVLADGVYDDNGTKKTFDSAPNWGIIDEGTWQGYTRPDVINPLNVAFDEMSKYWYGALVSIYKPEKNGYTRYMGGDLFHEGGNRGSLTDEDLAEIAKKIQDTQALYFGKDGNRVTWVIQSWQGTPYQGIRNGVYTDRALIQLLDKDMSQTGGVRANFYAYKSTGVEHIPWIWAEVMNFGGNTGMHGGVRRFRNLSKIGTDDSHRASFKGYGILSEGLETNPMMYDMINDGFTRAVGQDTAIDDKEINRWVSDYCLRRYGLVDDNLKTAYGILLNTTFDCSRYQEGCVENMLCAGPSAAVLSVSKWGPKGGIEYDPAELYPAAYAFLDAAKAHPELLKLETFQYDFVELFLQLIGERGRLINADIVTPGEKRDLFLKMFDLAERLSASSDRWRLDWHEARMKTSRPDGEGVRGYRRMITCWADGYAAGQATGLREYAHRAYAGLFKDYYLKRWLHWFDKLDGKITEAQYAAFLSELDDSFVVAELEATPKGDLIEIGEEILETLNPPVRTPETAIDDVDSDAAPAVVARVGSENFVSVEEAISASDSGAEIVVIADTALTIKNRIAKDFTLTISEGVTLVADIGKRDPFKWGYHDTINVFGTLDLGAYSQSVNGKFVINLYAGGKIKTSAKNAFSAYRATTLNVLAKEGEDTAIIFGGVEMRSTMNFNVAENVTLIWHGDMNPPARRKSVSAPQKVKKSGAGKLVFEGLNKTTFPIEVNAGSFAHSVGRKERFSAVVKGGSVSVTSADEDCELVESFTSGDNVHTWSLKRINWLYLVTDPGEVAQNGHGKKFIGFKEAYEYAMGLRNDCRHSDKPVKIWGMVVNETEVKAEIAEVGTEMGLSLDVSISPAGMEVIGWDCSDR